eukprot:1160575-Pelagomonas_calceolata.AAC.6
MSSKIGQLIPSGFLQGTCYKKRPDLHSFALDCNSKELSPPHLKPFTSELCQGNSRHKCWSSDPHLRPTFAELKQMLAPLMEQTQISSQQATCSVSYLDSVRCARARRCPKRQIKLAHAEAGIKKDMAMSSSTRSRSSRPNIEICTACKCACECARKSWSGTQKAAAPGPGAAVPAIQCLQRAHVPVSLCVGAEAGHRQQQKQLAQCLNPHRKHGRLQTYAQELRQDAGSNSSTWSRNSWSSGSSHSHSCIRCKRGSGDAVQMMDHPLLCMEDDEAGQRQSAAACAELLQKGGYAVARMRRMTARRVAAAQEQGATAAAAAAAAAAMGITVAVTAAEGTSAKVATVMGITAAMGNPAMELAPATFAASTAADVGASGGGQSGGGVLCAPDGECRSADGGDGTLTHRTI